MKVKLQPENYEILKILIRIKNKILFTIKPVMYVSFNSFAANKWYHKWFDRGGHASTAATMLAKA